MHERKHNAMRRSSTSSPTTWPRAGARPPPTGALSFLTRHRYGTPLTYVCQRRTFASSLQRSMS